MSAADVAVERRIDELIAALEPLDDPRLAPAKELVQVVLELHTRGLSALMTLLGRAGEAGRDLVETCTQDREVSALLLLHGLHPHPLEQRVRQALEGMRGELGAEGVRAHFVNLHEGVLELRLEARAQRNFSAPKLRAEIEAAVLERAPEIGAVNIEGLPEAGDVAFVPLAGLKKSAGRRDASRC